MKVKRFNEFLLEDVGAKYAERRFNIEPNFSDFDKKYRRMLNSYDQEIAYRDQRGVIIIKNPKTLDNFGSYVRGVIDLKGNLFIEQEPLLTHNPLLRILEKIGVIKYLEAWHRKIPTNFLTVQRLRDTNTIKVGESVEATNKNNEFHVESMPLIRDFLAKAKLKNPEIDFVIDKISRVPGLRWLPSIS